MFDSFSPFAPRDVRFFRDFSFALIGGSRLPLVRVSACGLFSVVISGLSGSSVSRGVRLTVVDLVGRSVGADVLSLDAADYLCARFSCGSFESSCDLLLALGGVRGVVRS